MPKIEGLLCAGLAVLLMSSMSGAVAQTLTAKQQAEAAKALQQQQDKAPPKVNNAVLAAQRRYAMCVKVPLKYQCAAKPGSIAASVEKPAQRQDCCRKTSTSGVERIYASPSLMT